MVLFSFIHYLNNGREMYVVLLVVRKTTFDWMGTIYLGGHQSHLIITILFTFSLTFFFYFFFLIDQLPAQTTFRLHWCKFSAATQPLREVKMKRGSLLTRQKITSTMPKAERHLRNPASSFRSGQSSLPLCPIKRVE